MPRITVKTNVFLNREKKYRMTLEFKEAIELIPCEKGSFVMACIIRDGNVLIPSGNDCIQLNDRVLVVTTHQQFDDLMDAFE